MCKVALRKRKNSFIAPRMATGYSLGLEKLTFMWTNSGRETAGEAFFFFLKGYLC